jgi:hypothetical protein
MPQHIQSAGWAADKITACASCPEGMLCYVVVVGAFVALLVHMLGYG